VPAAHQGATAATGEWHLHIDHVWCQLHAATCARGIASKQLQGPLVTQAPYLASSVMKLWQKRITSASERPLGSKSLPPCKPHVHTQQSAWWCRQQSCCSWLHNTAG
jgi:hypothetical protein